MNTITLQISVKPKARLTFFELKDNNIVANIAAPPVDGKANKELLRAIAKKLKIPQSQVQLHVGTTSKYKFVKIVSDLTKEEIINKLIVVSDTRA